MGRLETVSFYCYDCEYDFDAEAEKRYKNKTVGEVWRTDCPKCGEELIRLEAEKASLDPYFRHSRKLMAQRRKYSKEIKQ